MTKDFLIIQLRSNFLMRITNTLETNIKYKPLRKYETLMNDGLQTVTGWYLNRTKMIEKAIIMIYWSVISFSENGWYH